MRERYEKLKLKTRVQNVHRVRRKNGADVIGREDPRDKEFHRSRAVTSQSISYCIPFAEDVEKGVARLVQHNFLYVAHHWH